MIAALLVATRSCQSHRERHATACSRGAAWLPTGLRFAVWLSALDSTRMASSSRTPPPPAFTWRDVQMARSAVPAAWYLVRLARIHSSRGAVRLRQRGSAARTCALFHWSLSLISLRLARYLPLSTLTLFSSLPLLSSTSRPRTPSASKPSPSITMSAPTPTPVDPNSFAALCDGVETAMASQPPRPSGSVLRARRRALFGLQLPTSSAGNIFLDLYSADGLSITFRSLADVSRATSCATRRTPH